MTAAGRRRWRFALASAALAACAPRTAPREAPWTLVDDPACTPPADADRIRVACPAGSTLNLREATGDLEIRTDVRLETLTRVVGRLSVPVDAAIPALHAPALSSAGAISLRSPALRTWTAPGLTTVATDLRLTLAALDALDLPALTCVGGTLEVSETPSLTRIDAPNLDRVGAHVVIRDASALTTISMPRLRHVAGAFDLGAPLGQAPAPVTTLDLPLLTRVDGGLSLRATRLAAIELPALSDVTGGLLIAGNLWAHALQLPALARVEGDAIVENQPLDADRLLELQRQLTPITTGVVSVR